MSSRPVIPKWIEKAPLSRVIRMNLPRRRTDSIRRPAKRAASAARFPGVTKREVNSADRISRPVRCRATVRTTVSTSGNSGTSGNVDQNIGALDLDGERVDADVGVEIVEPGAAIVFPGVPRTHQCIPVQRPLPERSPGVRANAVQSVQLAAHVADGIAVLPHQGFHDGPRRELGNRRHFHKSHQPIVSPSGAGLRPASYKGAGLRPASYKGCRSPTCQFSLVQWAAYAWVSSGWSSAGSHVTA